MDRTSVAQARNALGDGNGRTAGLAAAGGIFGAILASSCCIVPLVLFSLGITGAWMGRLTALAPYQPVFLAVAIGCLGYGHWLVHRAHKAACVDDMACARPLPNRLVRISLWLATFLVILILAWPYIVPLILE